MPTVRVIEILEIIASSPKGLTLSQIAEKLNYPRSTLMPILKTLTNRSYLSCNPDTLTYNIDRQLFILGNTYNETSTSLELIKEQMMHIVDDCNETCHLGILSGNKIMYIQKVSGTQPIQFISSIGKKLPAYATALGKALLFDHNQQELEIVLGRTYMPLTKNTITKVEALYKDIHKDGINNFTYEKEEITNHARCIAKPLRLNGRIIAAISVSFLVFNSSHDHVKNIKSALNKYSTIIEKLIHSRGFSY
ncbi:IclR family transcriptional regulator [uncultured Veillonella sp.]|uniref:IclR family transcriptional regulator n=1 Tax=uncultured Veillonella sp. TaxID=159268 RepID=UPI0025E6DB13|nr:IclR family transcriptional regulator [uncultured Veillonella sp.]MDY3974449.1 IclR family transcriptional regulator [Veillonella caviae]